VDESDALDTLLRRELEEELASIANEVASEGPTDAPRASASDVEHTLTRAIGIPLEQLVDRQVSTISTAITSPIVTPADAWQSSQVKGQELSLGLDMETLKGALSGITKGLIPGVRSSKKNSLS
jgi:hypothetical protein